MKIWMLVVLAVWANQTAWAQVVGVSLRLATNAVAVDAATTLFVEAQVLPVYRGNVERIFSWYIDVLNGSGAVAKADYGSMTRPASDRDPATSSGGFDAGTDRRGVYDTFLNLPGAGTTVPVVLLAIPVRGLAPGQTEFRVQAGTGVPGLSADFIAVPSMGGGPLLGGDYASAHVTLRVADSMDPVKTLSITQSALPDGQRRVVVTYAAVTGYDCFVEYRDLLRAGVLWKTFPDGPHNSGVYRDTNSVPTRFYRIHAIAR